jgi:hypothetical protein
VRNVEGVAVGYHHDVHVRGCAEFLCLAGCLWSTSNDLFGTVLECIVGDVTEVGDLEVIRQEPESWDMGNLGDFATSVSNISVIVQGSLEMASYPIIPTRRILLLLILNA